VFIGYKGTSSIKQAGVKGERLIVAAHHGLRRRGY
jgi:hypothetical protein